MSIKNGWKQFCVIDETRSDLHTCQKVWKLHFIISNSGCMLYCCAFDKLCFGFVTGYIVLLDVQRLNCFIAFVFSCNPTQGLLLEMWRTSLSISPDLLPPHWTVVLHRPQHIKSTARPARTSNSTLSYYATLTKSWWPVFIVFLAALINGQQKSKDEKEGINPSGLSGLET